MTMGDRMRAVMERLHLRRRAERPVADKQMHRWEDEGGAIGSPPPRGERDEEGDGPDPAR